MSNASDFIIENGVLKEYNGSGGDVVIPEGVTSIWRSAFFMCEGLKSVQIPEGVSTIGARAFYDCRNLTKVVLPEGVIGIGDMAFNGCSKLKDIRFPNSIVTIGAGAFYGCKKLADSNGMVIVGNVLCGYYGIESNVNIPDGVIRIDDKAFSECSGLVKIALPESVVSIGRNAFYNCKNLRSVQIPSSVTDIGENAFWGCENLADDEGFVIIHDVLYGYFGRGKVATIPQHVAKIADMAFYRCNNLETVVIPENAVLCETLRSDSAEPKSIIVPDLTVDPVSGDTIVASVAAPVRNNIIGRDLFSGSTKLKTIIAPAVPFAYFDEAKRSVPAILGFLFNKGLYQEPAIVAEYIKNSVSQKKKILPILFEADMVQGIEVFAEAGKITTKNVDKEFLQPAMAANATQCVAYLMNWKSNNQGRSEKHKSDELTKDMFNTADMKKLWSFEKLPDGTLEITGYKGEETEIIIPERIGKIPVTAIGKEAFSPDKEKRPKKQAAILKNINAVTIPESVKTIGSKAFFGCEKLANSNGFVIVGNVLYNYYGSDESVVIPDGVTVIGSQAFGWNGNLKTVTMPEGVNIIDELAFFACTGLISAEIPDSVTVIGNDAFCSCSNLEDVSIPNSLTTIGDSAFSLCYKLKRIHISAGVIHIGDMTFHGCSKLTIHAPAGSYAEQYAEKHNIPFVAE